MASDEYQVAAQGGKLSNEALEAKLRSQMNPLISFLEEAEKYDGGYPDQYPENERVDGEPYRKVGLNIDTYGCTLDHHVEFSVFEESGFFEKRKGHGRFLQVTAFSDEHSLNGGTANLAIVILFESGAFHFMHFEDELRFEFDPENDVFQAMKLILEKYLDESLRVERGSFRQMPLTRDNSRACARVQALAEIAAEHYNAAYGIDQPQLVTAAKFDSRLNPR